MSILVNVGRISGRFAAAALLTLALLAPLEAQFVQQGPKLVGTGAFGLARQGNAAALSADGNTALVAGFGDYSAGAVWVYTRSNGAWAQQGPKLVGTGAVTPVWQGRSVGLSADGNTAIVGGPLDNGGAGAVWIFTRSGGAWTQQGLKLVGTGATGAAQQGWSVALSADGNTAAVGGTNNNGGVGAMWIFTRTSGMWSQQQTLIGTGVSGQSNQGWSVALSADGNTAATGGIGDNNLTGAVWVFTRTTGIWSQQGQKLADSGAAGQAHQGYSLALSADGNTAVTGGPNDNNNAGAFWVYTRSNSAWSQQGQKLVATGAIGAAQLGSSIGLSGDGNTAVLGGLGDNVFAGAIWIYTRTNGVWSQKQKLVGTGAVGTTPAQQGTSAALSADGNTAVAGGSGDSESAGALWAFVGSALGVTKTHSGNFFQGQTGATYTITVSNPVNGTATSGDPVSGKVTVTDVAPSSALFNLNLTGTGWTCVQNGCSRSDVLAPGSSYPPITVTANVAASATDFTNTASVNYGASAATASDPTTVTAVAPPPHSTVTPTSGSGSSQVFTFSFPSANGYQDLAGAQIVINSSLTAVNSCYILFARPDTIYLADDTGLAFKGASFGAPASLQNSQCVVLGSLSSQSGSGNVVTLTLDVVFKAGFAGPKTVWAFYNNNAGVGPGYEALGTYTATVPTVSFASSVSPASGSKQAQAFTFSYFDSNGAPDISGAQIVFNATLSGANSCYIRFSANNNVSLASDDATTFSTAVLGQQTALQNSQCRVFPGASYQTQSGQNLSLTLLVAFNPGFAGAKNIYTSFNNNAGTNTGYSTLGTWTVPASAPLSINSVSPASATGPSQALTFLYANPVGYADIVSSQVIVNPTQSAVNSCSMQFNRAAGSITLATDDGAGSTTSSLGQATTLQNSQCIVNLAASSQLGAGNYLTLTLFITMKTSGNQNVYSGVAGGLTSVPVSQFGTWNVTSPASMLPLSVTPLTGAGAAGGTQFLTFTLADPAGANDISGALILLYPSLQGVNACYILWGHTSNLLSLASDDALTFTSGATGAAGPMLSNSQCTVDPSQSFSVQTGNTVNLTVALAFKPVFQQFPQIYSWVNVQNTAHLLSGWYLLSRFSVQ